MSADLIDFSIIEAQKENIQSLPSGRSARALANLYSAASPLNPQSTPTPSDTTNLNDVTRREYEEELINISESDDPLDIYDRYVKWTLDAYPSSQATKESQLLPLLERATKTFQKDTQYKNDPRYLKLWLLYIRLFSDAPRETFAFLARHSIGDELALFYEEFAAWLEGAQRWTQAEEVFTLGTQKNARPVARLARKYNEFQQRYALQPQAVEGPKSPALPMVRAALVAKIDPFATAAAEPSETQPQQQGRGVGGGSRAKSGKPKMQIFADADDTPSPAAIGGPTQGWDSIGTLADRRKENTIAPTPWAGETLKTGGKKNTTTKMAVFKDESQRIPVNIQIIVPRKEQVTMNERTKRHERIHVNLERLYPGPDSTESEYCFEELRAAHRGWLMQKWEPEILKVAEATIPSHKRALNELKQGDVDKVIQHVQQLPSKPTKKNKIQVFQETEDQKVTEPAKLGIFMDIQKQAPEPETKPARIKVFQQVEEPRTAKVAKLDIFVDVQEEATMESLKHPKLEVFQERECAFAAVQTSQTNTLTERGDTEEQDTYRDPLDVSPRVNDENAPMLDENGAVKVPLNTGRHKKLRAVEVNETQIIKTKLSSPSGNKKVKRRNNAEPTMTFHTKAATDEIYDLFSQPLEAAAEQEEEDDDDKSDDEDDEETDGDYTSGGESTATGGLLASEAGEEEDVVDEDDDNQDDDQDDDDADAKSASEWSDFTTSKHVPGHIDENNTCATHVSQDEDEDADDESNVEPSPRNTTPEPRTSEDVFPRTSFVPIPPEDYVAPTRPYRNADEVSQNRLPFMTPIAEKTESSLGALTYRGEKDYFSSKTPSKEYWQHNDDHLADSPSIVPDVDETEHAIAQLDLGRGFQVHKDIANVSSTRVLDIVPQRPIIKDLQCNPVDDYTRDQIFQALWPPLTAYHGYFDHTDEDCGRGAEIRRFCKAVSKASKGSADKTSTNITMPPILSFPGSSRKYMVRRELGAGAFAPVFLLENVDQADEAEADDSEASTVVCTKRQQFEALKMEDPPTAWEFYILRQAKHRLGNSRAAESVIDVYEMHLYKDECYLVEEYRDQGTLLDLVNVARADSAQAGGVMDEIVAMFFTIELLRTIEALHSNGLLHGDLKADNCLVRLDSAPHWTSKYQSDGSGGWSKKGLSLIDFGRGIDMKTFEPNVQFIADWKTCAQDCAEMRELRPWTWQIDYFGAAGIIHSLLFGRYIETVVDKASSQSSSVEDGMSSGTRDDVEAGAIGTAQQKKSWKTKESLKRYWQTELWNECFHLLLNPANHLARQQNGEGRRLCLPALDAMREVRVKMEVWVEANCDRGVGLQAGIRRLEAGLVAAKRK